MKKLAFMLACLPAIGMTQHADRFQLGLQYNHRNMGYEHNAKKMFRDNFNQVGFYTGYCLHKYMGIEFNLFTSSSSKVNKKLDASTSIFNIANYNDVPHTYKSKTELNGGGLSIQGFYPFMENMKAFVTAGIQIVHLRLRADLTEYSGAAPDSYQVQTHRIVRNITRAMPSLGIGVDWHFHPMFGVKANLTYQDSSKMKKEFYIDAHQNKMGLFKAKSSTLVGLSAYLNI